MSKSRSIPEELIKIKAHQFWKKRQLEGRDGTPESDWIEARQYLEKHRWEVFLWRVSKIRLPKKSIREVALWWETTPVEKILEDIEFLLKKSAFLSILGSINNLAILVGIVSFVGGENIRRNNEVFAAWQTITSAHQQSGSGGRKRALEFLHSRPWRFPWIWWTFDLFPDKEVCKEKLVFGRRWKREPLTGLSAPNAYLTGIVLCGADLSNADLSGADLENANLSDAYLENINLSGKADLRHANLRNAGLFYADLRNADLRNADLIGAYLIEADLRHANLSNFANLRNADLSGADLSNANLIYTILNGANLSDADLSGADLAVADLRKVIGLTRKQIKSACFWNQATYILPVSENQQYIKELEEDKSSDPKKPPDCSRWSR